MINNITAIILAGGKSSRMKCDKAFLKLGEKTMIEELVSRIEKKFSKLIIVTNDTGKCEKLDAEIVTDIFPEKGPLGGIYTGLIKSNSFYNFIFACDMPFINFDLVNYMIDNLDNSDIAIPRWKSRFEPLHAVYSQKCINPIKAQLEKNDLKINNLFSRVNMNIIEQEDIEKFGLAEQLFLNMNTKDDYHAALKMLC